MPTPIACALIKTSPGFGSGTGTSSNCITPGGPGFWTWMSFMSFLRRSARYDAIGTGAAKKFFIAYHSKSRFLLKPALCAVCGKITNCRSPFGS